MCSETPPGVTSGVHSPLFGSDVIKTDSHRVSKQIRLKAPSLDILDTNLAAMFWTDPGVMNSGG